MSFEPRIGLEIHLRINTQRKAFSNDLAKNSDIPNTYTSPVSLGLPGTLPVLNSEFLEKALLLGIACNCKINNYSEFARKSYFYDDLPKGYQITQFEKPLCENGYLECFGENIIVEIERIHLEEDTAKTIFIDGKKLLDYNRAGMPLVEIVTKPLLINSKSIICFLKEIQLIAKYLNISNASLENGEFRVDVNVSLSLKNDVGFRNKVELKNLNSFRNIEKAINYEINRQELVYLNNENLRNETRFWDEKNKKTIHLRYKEESEDYRFFPEPDLPAIILENKKINELQKNTPLLPYSLRKKFIEQFGLTPNEVSELINTPKKAILFDRCIQSSDYKAELSKELYIIINSYLHHYFETDINFNFEIESKIIKIANLIYNKNIAKNEAKKYIELYLFNNDTLIHNELSSKDIKHYENIINIVLLENIDLVEKVKAGNKNIIAYLIKQVLLLCKDNVNPKYISELINTMIFK